MLGVRCTRFDGAKNTYPSASGWSRRPDSSVRENTEKRGANFTGEVSTGRLDEAPHSGIGDTCALSSWSIFMCISIALTINSLGTQISKQEERIRGALKYQWAEGISQPPEKTNLNVRLCSLCRRSFADVPHFTLLAQYLVLTASLLLRNETVRHPPGSPSLISTIFQAHEPCRI